MNSLFKLLSMAAVMSFALLIGQGSAFAQMSKDDQKCVDKANNGLAKLGKTQTKENTSCVKDATKGKQLPEACLSADPKGKVFKAKSKIAGCDPPNPIPIDKATAENAFVDEALELAHDIFGSDLDTASLGSPPKDQAKCAVAVIQKAGDIFAEKAKAFRKCKKDGMKAGTITDPASLQAACLPVGGIPDPKGKINKRITKLDDAIDKKCMGLMVPWPQFVNGRCAGLVGAGLRDCVDARVECRICNALSAADGLSTDCDLFDNGLADGSCGGQAECQYTSPPMCGGTCPQGETCVDIGTACVCLQDSQECTQTGAPTCPGWCADPTDQCLDRASTCQCLPPTACEASSTGACGGSCPPGESCVDTGSACVCQPAPCQQTYPTCNGPCPPGEVCIDTGSACVCQLVQPLDHYTLYEASGPDGPPVTLVDQFQTQVVDLGTVRFFMVPASKNGEPIHDPVSHLTCYDIPEGQFGASVEVDNQFGPDFLGVGDPLALCVPTEKFPGPVPIPLLRDHYKCYEAGGYSMLGPSILLDQFQSWEPFLWDVMLFCAPVDKNGEGILNPYDEHLTCYLGDPPGISPGPVAVRNQFHEGDLFVDWPFALCVPSIKLGWSPL